VTTNAAVVHVAEVRPGLVPVKLQPNLSAIEDTALAPRFARAARTTLVAGGALWAIRDGAVLVGALQISLLKPEVNLAHASQRTAIVTQILPGSYETITVDGTSVAASATADETFFLWFSRGMFEVLQVKSGTGVSAESVVTQLISYQKSIGALQPIR